MKNREFKVIERAFYNYQTIMQSAVKSTVDLAEKGIITDYMKLPVQSSNRGARENKLCAIIDDELKKVRWCYVVEKVLDHYYFEKDKVKFIRMHYFDRKTETEACMSIGICRATMFNWRNEILETAYKWAKELRLI